MFLKIFLRFENPDKPAPRKDRPARRVLQILKNRRQDHPLPFPLFLGENSPERKGPGAHQQPCRKDFPSPESFVEPGENPGSSGAHFEELVWADL